MDDLVTFLRARLDEDEAHALIAAKGRPRSAHWSLDEWLGREEPHSLIAVGSETQPTIFGHFTADPVPTAQATHIARHDPARVLREVEAKRAFLDTWLPEATKTDEQVNEEWGYGSTLASDVLRLLALPYSDHPDYRDDWRP
jgi:uncharacterized protein DUF6221